MKYIKANSDIFYNEKLKCLLQQSNKGRFLINFENTYEKKFWFFQKYGINKQHKQLFIKYLNFLQKGRNEKKAQEKIQKKLQQQTTLRMNQFTLKINNINIFKMGLLDQKQISGVFIHRHLNLPHTCYSKEINQKGKIIYRLRNKIKRSSDMIKQNRIKQMYKQYENFYLDSYENFIKHQMIKRQLYYVYAEITGKLLIKKNNHEINLPIDKEKPITKHLMQLQSIVIRNQPSQYVISDIDYLLKGNSHIV